jgi:hypothetical protein
MSDIRWHSRQSGAGACWRICPHLGTRGYAVHAPKLSEAPFTVVLMQELSDFDRDILVFARSWYVYRGSHEAAVRAKFGLSALQYFQHLNRIIELPEAEAFDAFTTRRLRRVRDRRKWSRTA